MHTLENEFFKLRVLTTHTYLLHGIRGLIMGLRECNIIFAMYVRNLSNRYKHLIVRSIMIILLT